MKLLASCLEASANLHLEQILCELAKIEPNLELYGIFDVDKFKEHKVRAYCDYHEFNAMGFLAVLPLILKARRAVANLVSTAINNAVDVILLIDSPAFNVPFAKALRKAGYKGRIVYYILPQVWAWKKSRVQTLSPLCDALVGILPFEKDFWPSKFHYFGNPIFHSVKSYLKTEASVDTMADCRKVAFLPGSRKKEIKALMPVFRQLAKKIKSQYPDARLLLSIAPNVSLELYEDVSDFILYSNSLQALNEADFAYVCSGSASLQAGLIATPMCLVYKANSIDYFIAKNLVKISKIGLCNIIFERVGFGEFHPEFVQDLDVHKLFLQLQNYDAKDFLAKALKLRELLKDDKINQLAQLIKEK